LDVKTKRLVAKALVRAAAVIKAGLVFASLPRRIVAFHGGRPWVGDKPDVRYVGSGEATSTHGVGNVLGPGVYFATEEGIAKLYLKYGGNRPTLHKVLIDTKGLYESRSGKPLWLLNNIEAARDALVSRDEFKAKLKYDSAGNPTGVRGHDVGKHGQGRIGDIFALLGAVEGRKLLRKAGVTGVFERLPAGGYEIAVFDPRIVSLLEKMPVYDEDEALEKDKKDEADRHQMSIDFYGDTPELDDRSRKALADAIEFFKKNPSLRAN
jgi:hypothetical protein